VALGAWIEAQDKTPGGSLAAAKALFEKALASQDPLLRPAALNAVARSGKADVAAWVLNDAKDKRLRMTERFMLVAYVSVTPKTRDQGYDWLKANVDDLLKGGGGVFLGARLPQILGSFCAVDKAASIERDFAPKLAGKSGQLELDRTVERVRSCGVLKEARAKETSAQIAALK
jgi:hypothetical protein